MYVQDVAMAHLAFAGLPLFAPQSAEVPKKARGRPPKRHQVEGDQAAEAAEPPHQKKEGEAVELGAASYQNGWLVSSFQQMG